MKLNRKMSVIAVAIVAAVLIGAGGAYAYWSAQQQLAGNTMASGHMSISVLNGDGSALTSLSVANLMPGQSGSKKFEINSASNNPATDLAFAIGAVTGQGTLKDNINVTFLLQTDLTNAWWLTPSGPLAYDFGSTPEAQLAIPGKYGSMTDYSGKSWNALTDGLTGYSNLAPGAQRHITVYYTLPVNCAEDCHDSDFTFPMTFTLYQHH